MKLLLLFAAFSLYSLSICAQVGIGTTTPDSSSILEIESTSAGILIPRMSSGDRTAISAPLNSLMVFNTTTNTYQYNAGTAGAPVWNNISYNPTVKYSNSNTTTNINVATAIDLPLFGNLIWNDDTALYAVSGNVITISGTGKYRITVNIFYNAPDVPSNHSERRISVLAQLALNGTQTGTIAATGYIRHDDNHNEASLNFSETLEINSGTDLSLRVFRGGNTANAFMDSNGTSNITIEKLN